MPDKPKGICWRKHGVPTAWRFAERGLCSAALGPSARADEICCYNNALG